MRASERHASLPLGHGLRLVHSGPKGDFADWFLIQVESTHANRNLFIALNDLPSAPSGRQRLQGLAA
ncbi:hypothetical protein EVAR_46351_1 [Eumeta japonica]|uniref:Uncharacterized protein n=1 Tax=Eumeta variegata TaxID=151549 RepID=A0A4C1WYD8_EUMVA|nr:hypothetical protein EVAR_46351_1 [Eumeta japonica]